jgi:hypothetical protein
MRPSCFFQLSSHRQDKHIGSTSAPVLGLKAIDLPLVNIGPQYVAPVHAQNLLIKEFYHIRVHVFYHPVAIKREIFSH